jgi:alpha-mannosidase
LKDDGDSYDIQTPGLALRLSKGTGAFTELLAKSVQWNVLGDARDGDALQLLGDSGSAWDINYTGENHLLTTEGARVTVLDQGPVFVRLRVAHTAGHSPCTQDVTVWGALPRIDIPTTVNWQEKHELLKIRLPVNASHPEAQGQIPFGSIIRPVNGQECPAQKWMDVSETVPAPVTATVPLDLSSLLNARCTENMDGSGHAFPAELLPAAGLHQLGPNQVPFLMPEFRASRSDHVVPAGQTIPLPTHPGADTLYLLAASINGSHATDLGFQFEDGHTEHRAFGVTDWVVNDLGDATTGYHFPFWRTAAGPEAVEPNMWIISIPLPKNATGLILPKDPQTHLFAVTLGKKPVTTEPYGLSVLNDGKYGFDVTNNLLRLTALRSSSDPDPEPDKGMQKFTYSLYPHAGGWRAAHTEDQALALNLPLLAVVTTPHPPSGRIPTVTLENIGGQGELIVTALKQSEDGHGYILRFYEADGADTQAQIDCDGMVGITTTDLLERPLEKQPATLSGHSAMVPVGHNQIVTVHIAVGS